MRYPAFCLRELRAFVVQESFLLVPSQISMAVGYIRISNGSAAKRRCPVAGIAVEDTVGGHPEALPHDRGHGRTETDLFQLHSRLQLDAGTDPGVVLGTGGTQVVPPPACRSPVNASAAKQSLRPCAPIGRLLRRCTPRNDNGGRVPPRILDFGAIRMLGQPATRRRLKCNQHWPSVTLPSRVVPSCVPVSCTPASVPDNVPLLSTDTVMYWFSHR